VIEVDEDRAERPQHARGLGHQPLERVLDRPRVGQARQGVGRRAELCDGEVPEVGEDRCRLGDRVLHAQAVLVGEVGSVREEDRPDHLSPHQQGVAGLPSVECATHIAADQLFRARHLVVRPSQSDRETILRLRDREPLGEPGLGRQFGCRLQPVRAVVAVEHHDGALGDRSFDVTLEQAVRLFLGLADLHGVGELSLGDLVPSDPLTASHHLVEGPAEIRELVVSPRTHPRVELAGRGPASRNPSIP